MIAILNLNVALMPPFKFQLNLTYGLRGGVFCRISRLPPWRPAGISERNDFSNSESLCYCDISLQVGVYSGNLGYRNGTILANLSPIKMVSIAAILNIGTERF